MPRVRISTRIALCLAMLSTTALVIAEPLGMLPDRKQAALDTRIKICESLAVHCTLLVGRGNTSAIQRTLQELAARHPEIRSAALRRRDGVILASVGDHGQFWQASDKEESTDAAIYVPIVENRERWGALEVAFTPLRGQGVWAAIHWDFYALMALTAAVNSFLFALFLRRVLSSLDPQRAVPERVRAALDTIVEGLLVLDKRGRIVLANRAFSRIADCPAESLQGRQASALPWTMNHDTVAPPWEEVLRTKADCTGVSLALGEGDEQRRSYVVNATPIQDGRGVLASFADVTALENKQRELVGMLNVVEESRRKFTRQNEELRDLAMRDPMTGCLNRRAFFEQFEQLWKDTDDGERDLVCIMTDIDHFKSVNDVHGHSRGDEVLKGTSAALKQAVGDKGIVCRFGGEEFCVLLPNTTADDGYTAAEGFRQTISSLDFSGLKVTASFGLATRKLGAKSQQELLDLADKCLYYSKRNGRNRVTRLDLLPAGFETAEPKKVRRRADAPQQPTLAVPFQAVTSLIAALSYRDPETAAHSRRVAELAVATARGLLSPGDTYLTQVAALLHDIGKVGVPDSILLKPEALTPDEWQIMRLNNRIGVEIVNASFQSPRLAEIVRHHHTPFGGDPAAPHAIRGEDIPLGARIIMVCDAFDSMTSDRVYRRGRTAEEAFVELRKMAGTQFDPQIVERFIDAVTKLPPQRNSDAEASPEFACLLGVQAELLAQAVDQRDYEAVRTAAGRLAEEAERLQRGEVQAAASGLLAAAGDDPDLNALAALAHDVIDLSLDAQQAALGACARKTSSRREGTLIGG